MLAQSHSRKESLRCPDVVTLKRNQNWATLSLNRPDKRNALNVEVLKGMDKALREVEHDKDIRAVIVRGEGRHFCAGIDLAEVEQAESRPQSREPRGTSSIASNSFLRSRSRRCRARRSPEASSSRSIAIFASRPTMRNAA